jgi:hypothetical protein
MSAVGAGSDLQDRVAALLDGSLGQADRAQLEQALLASPAARQQFRAAMRFHQHLRTELQLAAGVALARPPRRARWLAGAAALAAVLALALLWPRMASGRPPPDLRLSAGEPAVGGLLAGDRVVPGGVAPAPGQGVVRYDLGPMPAAVRVRAGSRWQAADQDAAPRLLAGVAGLVVDQPTTVEVAGLGPVVVHGRSWLTAAPWFSEVVVIEGQATVDGSRIGPGGVLRRWSTGETERNQGQLVRHQTVWMIDTAAAGYAAGRFQAGAVATPRAVGRWSDLIATPGADHHLSLGAIGPAASISLTLAVRFSQFEDGRYDIFFGDQVDLPALAGASWPIDVIRHFGRHDRSGFQAKVAVTLTRVGWSEDGPVHELLLRSDGTNRLRGWLHADPLRIEILAHAATVQVESVELRLTAAPDG